MNPPGARNPLPCALRLLALAAALGVLACGEEPAPPEPVARPVKLLEIGAGGASAKLEFPGEVKAGQRAEIGFEVAGKVEEFVVKEGEVVKAGAVLARIDPRDYQAELNKQQALLNSAQADFRRYQKLFEEDVASKQELDRYARNFEVTQARVAQARKAVDDTQVIAPFDGQVARTLVQVFENVQAKQPVVAVTNESRLEIVVNIPERDIAQIAPGQDTQQIAARIDARVTLAAIPDRSFSATLTELATSADPVTRTFAATFAFENPGDTNLRTGMTAKVTLRRADDAADPGSSGPISIPVGAAIQDEGATPYVWLIDDDLIAHRQEVAVGELSGDEVAITSGLQNGDRIAVSGVHHLREGMQVRRFEQ